MNSALGIVCTELERQGYIIQIEDIKVTGKEIFDNKIPSLEEVTVHSKTKLSRNGKINQEFDIEFVDYHQVIFTEYT